ncbi:unnamed protein product, partial [marine sediment metagenome]
VDPELSYELQFVTLQFEELSRWMPLLLLLYI